MVECYDVIIIGGGVIGSSIARELSQYNINICVLEKEADVCYGNSGRNTGTLHAGFNNKPNTLKAKFCVEGNKYFGILAEQLDITYKRTGKLTVACNEEQVKLLHHYKKQGEKNGVHGLEIIGRDEIRKIEPNACGEVALYSSSSGILCPYIYTIALAENAKLNGVDYFFEYKVIDIKTVTGGDYRITTTKGDFCSKWIINSCGLNAPEIAAKLGSSGHEYRIVKGEYIILDKKAGDLLHLPIYPVPDEKGSCDIHVTPTVDGNVLIGPSLETVKKLDFDNTSAAISILKEEGIKLFDKIKPEWFIRNYVGLLTFIADPTDSDRDFLIENKEETPHVINLIGINSPGLTCAHPISRFVVNIITEKERLTKNESFDPCRKGIKRFAEQDIETQRKMIEENPDYGEIICRCEAVTKAEILEALKNPLGVTNVNGIKYRTRATMGRCQGGYCETRITSIIQEELGKKKTEVRLSNSESYMFTGEVRESCK